MFSFTLGSVVQTALVCQAYFDAIESVCVLCYCTFSKF